MDSTLMHFTPDSTFSLPSIENEVCDAGATYSIDTALGLDTPRKSNSYFPHCCGSKRKPGMRDGSIGPLDGSSLDLLLGPSAISLASKGSSAISSKKEVKSFSSVEHRNLSLHLGEELKIPNLENISCSTVQRLKLDLELSLSTGAAESDVTSSVTPCSCTTPSSASFENKEKLITSTTDDTVQLLDEGSASSHWTFKPPVPPPLQTPQYVRTAATFDRILCHKTPTPGVSNLSSSASIHIHQQQRSISFKTCQVKGCGKGARGATGRCIAHGGGRRCQRNGCNKGAEGKTVFCKTHGGGRRCQHLGCTKSAEGRTDYCIGHGGGRRCSHEGCSRAARGKSGLCIRHGGGKRCKVENCSRSAEGISGLCISHGGGRRCQHPLCTKGAQGGTMFCKAHGGGKRCTAPGCTKGAEGSTPFCKGHGGGKRCTYQGGGVCPRSVHGGTLFCVSHGGGKRCEAPECTKSARGRTAYCVRHGGGKRCKSEGCLKSAQGSTDFCKAHGGGKRCSFGGQAVGICEKFARGKTGLCAAHSAQIQDVGSTQNPKVRLSKKSNEPLDVKSDHADGGKVDLNIIEPKEYGSQLISMQFPPLENIVGENGTAGRFSLPEGRVHGGSLMAMLRSSAVLGSSSDASAELGKSCDVPCSWL